MFSIKKKDFNKTREFLSIMLLLDNLDYNYHHMIPFSYPYKPK